MANVSISIQRGVDGFKLSDFTIGTAAPSGGVDFELRYTTTDQNSVAITRKDLHIALESMIRLIKEQGLQIPAGTYLLPGVGV